MRPCRIVLFATALALSGPPAGSVAQAASPTQRAARSAVAATPAPRAIPSPPTVTAAWGAGWSLHATIACPTRCTVTTRLRAAGRAIGRLGTRHLAQGETRTVVLHPSRAARSAIARSLGDRRRVEAIVTVAAEGHRPVVTRVRLL